MTAGQGCIQVVILSFKSILILRNTTKHVKKKILLPKIW